jgi:uncharacterized protein (TIGR02246 family)
VPNTATEAAADIRARLADAWNAGDAAAYAAEFTADASYVAFTGDVMNGGPRSRTCTVGSSRARCAAPGWAGAPTVGTSGWCIGVAVVVSSGGVQPAGAAELTADQASVQTSVLVEQDGRWLVAAFHNTRQEPRG